MWLKEVNQRRSSPDLGTSFSTGAPTLLASCSVPRRRFWDSLRGLAETSSALHNRGGMNEKPATRFPEIASPRLPPPRFGYYHKTDGSPNFGLWLQGHCWLLHIGVD